MLWQRASPLWVPAGMAGRFAGGGLWKGDDLRGIVAPGAEVLAWPSREGANACTTVAGQAFTLSTAFPGGQTALASTATSRMRCDALASLVAGTNLPFTVFVYCSPTATGVRNLLTFGNGTAAFPSVALAQPSGGTNTTSTRLDNTNTASGATSGSTPMRSGGRQVAWLTFNGNGDLRALLGIDAQAAASAPGTVQNVGSLSNVNRFTLGARWFGATFDRVFAGSIQAFGAFAGGMSAAEYLAIMQWCNGCVCAPLAWLGDSIMAGASSNVGGDTRALGVRGPIMMAIADNGWRVDACGPFWPAAAGGWAHSQNDGNSGFDLAGLITKFGSDYGPGTAQPYLEALMFMGGTNNMGLGGGTAYNPVSTPALYASALQTFLALFPELRLGVSTIPPVDPAVHAAGAANVNDFNSKLPAIWDAVDATRPARLALVRCDANTSIGGPAFVAANFADAVHPNAPGSTLIGNNWLAQWTPWLQAA